MRPLLQGRRDLPDDVRRRERIEYIERARGQPWTGLDSQINHHFNNKSITEGQEHAMLRNKSITVSITNQ